MTLCQYCQGPTLRLGELSFVLMQNVNFLLADRSGYFTPPEFSPNDELFVVSPISTHRQSVYIPSERFIMESKK